MYISNNEVEDLIKALKTLLESQKAFKQKSNEHIRSMKEHNYSQHETFNLVTDVYISEPPSKHAEPCSSVQPFKTRARPHVKKNNVPLPEFS